MLCSSEQMAYIARVLCALLTICTLVSTRVTASMLCTCDMNFDVGTLN